MMGDFQIGMTHGMAKLRPLVEETEKLLGLFSTIIIYSEGNAGRRFVIQNRMVIASLPLFDFGGTLALTCPWGGKRE